MRTTIKGKNLEVPEEDRRYVERKMGRLERYLDDRSEAVVELSTEHHRNLADKHIVDVVLDIDGRVLRGAAHAASHRAAVDLVVDRLERQATDLRERPRLRSRPIEEKQILRSIADGNAEGVPDRPRAVVKVKRFSIEPMFEEDAVARMEELGHSFFIFVNAENERVGVLYRRRDGDYGLIEPAVSGDYTMPDGRQQRRRR